MISVGQVISVPLAVEDTKDAGQIVCVSAEGRRSTHTLTLLERHCEPVQAEDPSPSRDDYQQALAGAEAEIRRLQTLLTDARAENMRLTSQITHPPADAHANPPPSAPTPSNAPLPPLMFTGTINPVPPNG